MIYYLLTVSNPEFLELAQSKIPTLVGIKHSSPELNSLMRCHVMNNEKYQILLGSDDVSTITYIIDA